MTGTPEVPAVVTPEVPAVEKLLQRLMTDTQSRPLPVVNPPAPTGIITVDASISRRTAPAPATATTMQWTSGYSDWGRRHRAVQHRHN